MKVLNLRGLLCFKNNHITSIILLVWLNTMFVWYDTKAQFYKPSEKTVRMGETLPDSFYQTIHQAVNAKTGKTTTIQLNDHKNKLIILDFWATWCGPCIYSLNKLDSITAPMSKENFVVIPVTYQSLTEAKPKLDRYKWSMTSIISDTTLAQIFPHSGIPHQVWIKNGKVIAIPSWTYTNRKNILKGINGQPTNMMMNVQDKVIDPLKPLFTKENGDVAPYFKTEDSAIGRYVPGFGPESLNYLVHKDTTILYCNNMTVYSLYHQAFKHQIFSQFSPDKMVHWEIGEQLRERLFHEPSLSLNGDIKQDSIFSEWRRKNNYGYNLRHPKTITKTDASKLMQQDLNQFFGMFLGINAKIEDSPKEQYLVLRTLNGAENATKLLKTKKDKSEIEENGKKRKYYCMPFGTHMPGSLIANSNDKILKSLILVDSTGINPGLKVDYYFPKTIDESLALTQKELARYGLYLKIEELQLPRLVIREKGYTAVNK